MKDAVDLAELLSRQGNGGAHLFEIRYVGLRDEQAAGERANLDQLADALLFDFSALGVVHCGFPLRLRRQRGAADENQASFEFARQMLGDDQAQAAQAAGDEVNASALEAGPRGRGSEIERSRVSTKRLPPR